jgi:hypothetical protein
VPVLLRRRRRRTPPARIQKDPKKLIIQNHSNQTQNSFFNPFNTNPNPKIRNQTKIKKISTNQKKNLDLHTHQQKNSKLCLQEAKNKNKRVTNP